MSSILKTTSPLRVKPTHLQGKAIVVEPLLEHISCPICTDIITDPKVTQCGHTFCHGCIDEWIARKKSGPNGATCPMCQSPNIVRTSLFKHHAFDNLLDTIMKQKDATERAYFDDLRQPSVENISTTTTNNLTPIEQVFRRHMQRSLGTFQNYASTIEVHFAEIERKHMTRLAQLRGIANVLPTTATTPIKVEEELKLLEEQIKEINEQQKSAMQQLVDKYDTFLSAAMPEPSLLPSNVPLFVAGRNDQNEQKHTFLKNLSLTIQPTSFPNIFLEFIYNLCKQNNDPIVTDKSLLQIHYIDSKSKDQNKGVIQLHENATIYQQIGGMVQIGGKFLIVGTFQLSSELPKNCFIHSWTNGSTEDYFKCTDCNKNWLCSSCALICHKNHTVVPFLTNHKPSFACCYCKKTKKCQLRKKNGEVDGGEKKH
jgi:hypothetical protein